MIGIEGRLKTNLIILRPLRLMAKLEELGIASLE
jgi:hypothetical protein